MSDLCGLRQIPEFQTLLHPIRKHGHKDTSSSVNAVFERSMACELSLAERNTITEILRVKSGKIRVARVKAAWRSGRLSMQSLIALWKIWRDQDDFIVIQHEATRELRYMLASKRGNGPYQWRLKNQFSEIDKLAQNLDFDYFEPNSLNKKTKALFITLTSDSKRMTASQAWQNVGKDWNRFKSALTRKYGKFSFLRCFESHANGYPHVHALLIFDKTEFDVFEHIPYNDIMKNTTWRIQQKRDFEKYHHSFIEIQAVNNVAQAIGYITKYMAKEYSESNPKYAQTQTLLWVHGKQSFSFSKDFAKRLKTYRLDRQLHNSNKKTAQIDLFGSIIHEKWDFAGVFSRGELEKVGNIIKKGSWYGELSQLPDLDR
ncbi:MAG: hypothetical protein OXC46_02970 [Thaumarchaeota archaeon]|nr:hypothetical protein [Nitrososphaerota archaeon]